MKLFKVIGFIISWLAPFGVIFINHVILEETQYDVDMFGLILVLALVIGIIKYIDGRVTVWDIQDKNKTFRIIWNNSKKILLAIGLTWILFTVENSMDKIQLSGILISICFIVGFVFTLLGNIKKKKTS
jgi:hypothetical protein